MAVAFRSKIGGIQYRILDQVVGSVRLRWNKKRFYADGWGDLETPAKVAFWIDTFQQRIRERGDQPPLGFSISWSKYSPEKELYWGDCYEGIYDTPSLRLDDLPSESRKGYVLYVKSKADKTHENNREEIEPKTRADSVPNPTVFLLAATGDHGYTRRLKYASDLAKNGINTVIHESPFYGRRKSREQVGSKLSRVEDLMILGRVTIEENVALLQYFQTNFGPGPYIISGASMGGLHAAMVASFAPIPVGAICWCAPASAYPVFSEGLMGRFCQWDLLERQLDRVGGSQSDPVTYLRDFLSPTDIERFNSPLRPEFTHITGAYYDEYVPVNAYARWEKLVQNEWKGATFSWLQDGHISGILLRKTAMCKSIINLVGQMKEQMQT